MEKDTPKEIKDARLEKIKHKYGKDAFKRWGQSGGSPILIQYAKDKRKGVKKVVIVIKKGS